VAVSISTLTVRNANARTHLSPQKLAVTENVVRQLSLVTVDVMTTTTIARADGILETAVEKLVTSGNFHTVASASAKTPR